MPDTDFKHLEESINALKSLGIKVSVDSSNNEELIRASNAGADYILSVNEKNFHIVDKINCIPILIPSEQGNLKSLERIILEMLKRNKDFIAIERYSTLRKKFPNIKILMGTGNLRRVGTNNLMGIVSE